MTNLTCLCTVHDSLKAEMIRSALESRCIDCFLSSNDASGVLSYLNLSQGIQVMIRKEDQKDALVIANEILGSTNLE